MPGRGRGVGLLDLEFPGNGRHKLNSPPLSLTDVTDGMGSPTRAPPVAVDAGYLGRGWRIAPPEAVDAGHLDRGWKVAVWMALHAGHLGSGWNLFRFGRCSWRALLVDGHFGECGGLSTTTNPDRTTPCPIRPWAQPQMIRAGTRRCAPQRRLTGSGGGPPHTTERGTRIPRGFREVGGGSGRCGDSRPSLLAMIKRPTTAVEADLDGTAGCLCVEVEPGRGRGASWSLCVEVEAWSGSGVRVFVVR